MKTEWAVFEIDEDGEGGEISVVYFAIFGKRWYVSITATVKCHWAGCLSKPSEVLQVDWSWSVLGIWYQKGIGLHVSCPYGLRIYWNRFSRWYWYRQQCVRYWLYRRLVNTRFKDLAYRIYDIPF